MSLDESRIREAVEKAKAAGWRITASDGWIHHHSRACCALGAVIVTGPGRPADGSYANTAAKLLGVTSDAIWAFAGAFDGMSGGRSRAHQLGRKFRLELLKESK